jgi:hypothetical protein
MEQAVKSLALPKLQLVLPTLSLVLSLGGAFGMTQFVKGRNAERLDAIEQRQKDAVTREEMKLFMESTHSDLDEIKKSVHEVRGYLWESRSKR